MWVPGVKGKGKGKSQRAAIAAAAAKQVGARSLPFLGVVHSASTTDKMTLERKLKRSTVALHHCNPPPSPRQVSHDGNEWYRYEQTSRESGLESCGGMGGGPRDQYFLNHAFLTH